MSKSDSGGCGLVLRAGLLGAGVAALACGGLGLLFAPAWLRPTPGVTQENFRRIHVQRMGQTGSTEAEVEALLGRPGTVWFRFTGSETLTWKGDGMAVTLEFSEENSRVVSGQLFDQATGQREELAAQPEGLLDRIRRRLGL